MYTCTRICTHTYTHVHTHRTLYFHFLLVLVAAAVRRTGPREQSVAIHEPRTCGEYVVLRVGVSWCVCVCVCVCVLVRVWVSVGMHVCLLVCE